MDHQEFGTIEREIFVEAAPEVVFEVVSDPEHVREWWPDEAHYDARPGATGEIVFGDPEAGGAVVSFAVRRGRPAAHVLVPLDPPGGEQARAGNSLLVTFELLPTDGGTRLRMTETGFREMGWEVAVLEEQYREHVAGWDHFLPRIAPYVARLGAGS